MKVNDLEADLAEGLKILRNALADGLGPLETSPAVLQMEEIWTAVSVFQPRDMTFRQGEDEAHLETLKKAIGSPERPNYLDPIVIWWGGDRWYVLDGHHRFEAYSRAGVADCIPVEVFTGGLDAAMAEAIARNSKNKLPMQASERTSNAWKLVVCSDLSKAEIVATCAVGEGTVSNARRVKRTLGERGLTVEQMLDLNWQDARRESDGRDHLEVDHDAAVVGRAQQFAKALGKAMKDRPHRDPEAFAMALSMLDERLPRRLMETAAWTDVVQEAIDEQADLEDSDY